MTDIRAWLDEETISADRARKALPILVRQARSERPITYQALSDELGMTHHRPVRFAAGHVGHTLAAVGRTRGWRRRPPPPLQSLIVNKETGLPGHGVNEFMNVAYRQAKTKAQRRAALNGVYAQIFSYPHWEEVLELLELESAPASSDAAIEAARNTRDRGGEGPEHKALKEFIAAHPATVGLRVTHRAGTCEFTLPSGDSVDVVFEGRDLKLAVEVKSRMSSDGDIARGLFQCVKYRAVMQAQSGASSKHFDVEAVLALGGSLPASLKRLRNSLSVPVFENIAVR